MRINKEIVKQAAEHVSSVLKGKLPDSYCYHNLSHTENVVEAVNEIAEGIELHDNGKQVLNVAAWFHDIGYIVQIEDHEITAAAMAEEFLSERGVDSNEIRQVIACIMATRYPQHPFSLLERVICDADMLHLGKKDCFEKSAFLREEWRRTKGENFTDEQWFQLNIDFIRQHKFHTEYCNDNYNKRKNKNIAALSKMLEKKEEKAKNGDKVKSMVADTDKKENELKPQRGVETLFRTASRNHMQLSSMADSKAHILLSINSIIISVIISVLLKKLEESTYLIFPTVLLLIVCLASIVFAVLTTKPKVSKGVFTKEQVTKREANLLFFGNFHNMDMETYKWGVREMMKDNDYLYGSMTKDIYFLGKVLAVKYRYLDIGYMVFMCGLVISVVSYGVSFFLSHASAAHL